MFHIRGEGQPIKTGLNFYPLSEWAGSRGFIFCLGEHRWMCRYSVKLERLVLSHYKAPR